MSKEFIWFDDRQVLDYITSEEGKNNLLPSVSIACAPKCNMACPHCIYDSGKEGKGGLTSKEKVSVLEQAVNLGAKFLQICHEGEPILDNSTIPLIETASELEIKTFMYTNASKITPEIAKILYDNKVRLGIHFDSLNPEIFDKMLGKKEGADKIYEGVNNLLKAGYNQPIGRNGRLYTKLGLITTLTSINTKNIEEIKDIAKYAWSNNIFFGAARLEKGGRAEGEIWEKMKVADKDKIINFIDWCSEQTGINYWYAQPTPYCIGVGGLQIAHNGNVWMNEYGGSCDFTEPDGESYPEKTIIIGNVKKDSLKDINQRAWGFRQAIFYNGVLDRKLVDYEKTKDIYPNGLQDCGSARTYTLFLPFYNYVKNIVENRLV